MKKKENFFLSSVLLIFIFLYTFFLLFSSMLLNYICPRRCAAPCKNAPTIVLPERHLVTAGLQRSMDTEVYAESLLGFYRHVFSIPMQYWKEHPTGPSIFDKINSLEVTRDLVRVYSYPEENVLNNEGLPVCLMEWDWESAQSTEEAFNQLRKYYFHPLYIDQESDYSLVETFPKFNNSSVASPLVMRAVWRPRMGFAKRDWVEFVGVDEKEKIVMCRSCMHPRFNECNSDKSILNKILESILPMGLIRAGCVYGCQIKPPKSGKKGCLVRVFWWYKMSGPVDVLFILGVPQVVNEMRKSTVKQFVSMANFLHAEKQGKQIDKPDFDLLNA